MVIDSIKVRTAKVLQNDQELIIRFQQGEAAAFDELVRRYERPIRNLCRYYLPDPQDIQDVAQETFIRVYHALGNYRPAAKFTTWLYRIAINQCLNALRSKRRRIWLQPFSRLAGTEEQWGRNKDGFTDPLQELEKRERIHKVREALKALPEDQRTAVILHRYQGLSYKEIAEVTNSSVAAVESRLHRAKIKLSELLEEYVKNS